MNVILGVPHVLLKPWSYCNILVDGALPIIMAQHVNLKAAVFSLEPCEPEQRDIAMRNEYR